MRQFSTLALDFKKITYRACQKISYRTMKKLTDELKQFFAREIAIMNENMNKKFDELTLKLNEIK